MPEGDTSSMEVKIILEDEGTEEEEKKKTAGLRENQEKNLRLNTKLGRSPRELVGTGEENKAMRGGQALPL